MSIPQPEPKKQSKLKRWHKIAIGVVVLVLIAVVAVPFVYINFIKEDAPDKLSLDDAPISTSADTTASTTAATATTTAPVDSTGVTTGDTTATTATAAPAAGTDGTYTITTDSQVGYRVVEVLFGQDTEGVGRTNSVTGTITVAGTQVTAAEFTVDMASVTSDESRRDGQFRGRLMETDTFPTATFTITQPIELGAIPADGEEISASATGDLTLHGVTKSVTLDVTAKKTGTSIAIAGSTDIKFADYDIEDPSTNGISVQDHGLLEFLLVANA